MEVVERVSYKFKKMHIDCDKLIAVAKEDDKMATAIKGSVIAGTKGSTVDYYRKCESCGYTSSLMCTATLLGVRSVETNRILKSERRRLTSKTDRK